MTGSVAAGGATAAGGPATRAVAVVACVVGAGLALLATSRTWALETEVRPAPLPPLRTARTGADLLPWLPALAFVALAGAGALLATRGLVRAVVGVLLILSGVGLAGGATTRLAEGASPTWTLVATLGGVLVGAAGTLALVHGRAWPGMAARYDRPAPAPTGEALRPVSKADLWDALDRGDDPTD
jgi:hypothetical protein